MSEEESLGWSDFAPENVGATVKRISGFGPDEELAQSLYEEGKQLYHQARFKEAAEKFEAAVKRAPVSLVQENALFMLGESLFFTDNYPEAEEAYAQLLADYDYTHHLDTVIARQFSIGRYWEEIDAAEPGWLTKFQYGDDTRPVPRVERLDDGTATALSRPFLFVF